MTRSRRSAKDEAKVVPQRKNQQNNKTRTKMQANVLLSSLHSKMSATETNMHQKALETLKLTFREITAIPMAMESPTATTSESMRTATIVHTTSLLLFRAQTKEKQR
ncbi:hypothetical protein V6N13_100443 [Hibiscus sabdariffa]